MLIHSFFLVGLNT
jgi:hypothetical protein